MQQDDFLQRMKNIDVKETHIMRGRSDAISALYGKDRKIAGALNSLIDIREANDTLEKIYESTYYETD